MTGQRSKEELLDIFEQWVDQTIACWQCEYGAWDMIIEDKEITD